MLNKKSLTPIEVEKNVITKLNTYAKVSLVIHVDNWKFQQILPNLKPFQPL